MKTYKIILSFLAIGLVLSCNKNPFTGKSDLALVSNSELFPMSFKQYDQTLKESNVITNTKNAQLVNTVGQNIAKAAEKYLKAKGYQSYLEDYKWEYHLLKSDQVNAWCMPGGKIAVYSGILPITQDEAGLAVVLGHEVSHALLNHSQRQVSQNKVTQLIGQGGSAALSGTDYGQLFNQLYGVGTQLGITLPYSRKFENQADELGLKLMAIAGYDPGVATEFWNRMNQQGGNAPPEFLSTHPSGQSRIQNLKEHISEAKDLAKRFGVHSFKK